MSCKELSLNWNDHPKTLVSVFEKLLERSTLVDCTIAAEGQYVKAHKVILSACSPYFELLFSQENEKNPIIILKDIKFRELEAIIDFVYRGKVKIPEDHLQDFVDAAESLQIKGLGVDQKKNNSGKRSNESENFERKKDKSAPLPRKRLRNSSLNNNEENSHQLSSEVLAVSENVASESRPHRETERNVSASSSTFLTHSVSDAPEFVNNEQRRHGNTEANFPCSLEPPVLSSEAVNVFAESVVVKSELEPVAEIFVPEPDGLVEPKKEECEEDEDDDIILLDDDDDEGVEQSLTADDIQHQESSRQLSSFSPLQESILGTDDSYAMQHMDHSSAQGVQWSCSGETQLSSSSWQPEAGPSESSAIPFTPLEDMSLEDTQLRLASLVQKCFEAGSVRDAKRAQAHGTNLCQICGYAYRGSADFANHMRKHTGERPFKCTLCGKRFLQGCHLKRHLLVHAGLRPYKCTHCVKSFARVDHLQKHQRVHTWERPYRCNLCEKTYTYLAAYKMHLRMHINAS